VYRNFLRAQAYTNLIRAENAIEPRKYGWLEIEYADFNCDDVLDVIAESHTMNLYFNPAVGGMITEFDYRPKAWNLIDTFTRKPEFYHPEGATYDTYPRRALVDHFLGAESNLPEFAANTSLELGDFTTGAFEVSKYRDRVTLVRDGFVRGPIGEPVPVEVKKAVRIVHKESRLEIDYRITNKGDVDVITRFGSEWGFGMLSGSTKDRYAVVDGRKAGSLGEIAEHRTVRSASLVDEWLGLEIAFDFDGRDVLLWRHPIETLEKTGDHFEKRYQSTVLLPLWDLDLPAGRSRRITYGVRISER
jgi:4-alpha-glucanotransferase